MAKREQLVWNVFRDDFNNKKIYVYNIFDHGSFWYDLIDVNKKIPDNNEFFEKVIRELQYYYWCKCEHEIMVNGLFSDDNQAQKIDIYTQVMNNEQAFKEYILAHRKDIPKKYVYNDEV